MIQEEGIVISVNNYRAKVEAEEKTACSSCAAHNICGQGSGGKRVVETINRIGARVGQRVKIELPSSSLVISSIVVFLIPTLLLIASIITGYIIGIKIKGKETGEILAAIAGIFAFIISFIIIRHISKRLDKDERFYPQIKEIIT